MLVYRGHTCGVRTQTHREEQAVSIVASLGVAAGVVALILVLLPCDAHLPPAPIGKALIVAWLMAVVYRQGVKKRP